MLTSQVAKHPVNKLSKMDYFYLTWLEWVLLEEVDLIQGICEPLLSNFHDSLSLELFLFSFPYVQRISKSTVYLFLVFPTLC